MVKEFQQYVSENDLFGKRDSVLLAVSGGIDSMVLLQILSQTGIKLAVAHCNFQLRGKESDEDESFVTQNCKKLNIKYFTKSFDTRGYAGSKGISIQMAARELRYMWFEEIRMKYSIDHIAVAHNNNDSIETFFINLIRGTGLNGLTGIKAKAGRVIRPLLFASREMIVKYAEEHNIPFREDSSNRESKYARNRIRNEIIPLMEDLNPSSQRAISETISRLNDVSILYNDHISLTKERLFKHFDAHIEIQIDELSGLKPSGAYIFDLFKGFGIGPSQAKNFEDLLRSESGKQFLTLTHRILRDRNKLIIEELKWNKATKIEINSEEDLLNGETFLTAKILTPDEFIPRDDPAIEYFDADLLKYPIRIRNWRAGDYFYPFGMQGRKKLSDLFIDSKIPVNIKEKCLVMESDGSIIWVIGVRSDNRFRVGDSTSKILELRL